MHDILDFLKSLYNAERLLELARTLLGSSLGLFGLFGIVFAETGLLVGFFLPGDSLLFSVGFASGAAGLNLYLLSAMLMVAAIVGDNVGYFLGINAGPHIFNRPKSRFFNPEHLQRTKVFYEKYGSRAIVYARFIPIVRTFTPFVSGVAEMPYPRFLLFSLLGGSLWIGFMMILGYQLGQVTHCAPELRESDSRGGLYFPASDVPASVQGVAHEGGRRGSLKASSRGGSTVTPAAPDPRSPALTTGLFTIAKGAAYSALLSLFPVLATAATLLVQTRAQFVERNLISFLSRVLPPGTESTVLQQFRFRGQRPLSAC